MKLRLDTLNKEITLESDVNLGEFVKQLSKLLPNKEWTQFKLLTNVVINNWSSPIIIERQPYNHPTPWSPYRQPWYQCGTISCNNSESYKTDSISMSNISSNNTINLTPGTFNIELRG